MFSYESWQYFQNTLLSILKIVTKKIANNDYPSFASLIGLR